jgi:hypothetical protein
MLSNRRHVSSQQCAGSGSSAAPVIEHPQSAHLWTGCFSAPFVHSYGSDCRLSALSEPAAHVQQPCFLLLRGCTVRQKSVVPLVHLNCVTIRLTVAGKDALPLGPRGCAGRALA